DYGFPYMYGSDAGGSVDTSTAATANGGGACGDPSPITDDLLPVSGFYEAAWGNYGPSDKPSSGETGYEDGGVYWSLAPHATPTGCAFYDPTQMDPAALKFPTEFQGRAFITTWGKDPSITATDSGHDLMSVRLSEGDDAFVCNRFWGGLKNP